MIQGKSDCVELTIFIVKQTNVYIRRWETTIPFRLIFTKVSLT